MRQSKYTKDKLQSVVVGAKSIADVLRVFKLKATGGNHRYISSKIMEHGIDTGHFTGQAWNKGRKLGENYNGTQKPLEEILVANGHYSSNRLRRRLISSGLKVEECEGCGLASWKDKKLPLELHHINSKPNDNRLTNLQILCPNCHSVVDT